jgi:uncharacterized protein
LEIYVLRVALSLTHNCNLSCKYCYAGKKKKKDVSLATAKEAVDFALRVAPQKRGIKFSFFGGEPLLRFDLIKKITNYIREKEKENEVTIALSVTSNGTLLTDSIFDFFKKENIELCISIDGPAHIHNLNRVYMDGRGSFGDVVEKLRRAVRELGNIQVNAVYGPITLEFLPETVSFFTQLGVSVIHLNPNIRASWKDDTMLKLAETYLKIADHYIENYKSGREIAINLIDSKIIVFLKGGYDASDRCGMAETEWGFAPSGNIYPCERFIGEDNNSPFCFGNVHDGIDVEHRCSLLEKRGNHNEECVNCTLQKYCMNWCGCTNYFMTGQTDICGPFMCKSEKAAIQAARKVLVTLKDNELFLDHFLKYLHAEQIDTGKEKIVS